MTFTRATFASLAVIAVVTTGKADWSYKTTQDGQYTLGRNDPEVSVEARTMTVSFRVPPDWSISACTDQPMNSIFSAGSTASPFTLDFIIQENSRKLSLAEQYRSYLKFIHGFADDEVQMRPEAKFRLPDGRKLTPRHYFSEYWGQRLVLLIPEGEYTCQFEFSASSLTALRASHNAIQEILQSYKRIQKKSSNAATQQTRASGDGRR